MLLRLLGRASMDPRKNLAAGKLIIRETVYGIVKRLNFLTRHIEVYRLRNGLGRHEVKVVDVGCGSGVNVTIPLASAGYSVTGIDIDLASIKRARELALGIENVAFHWGPLDSQRFPHAFHVAVCSEVIEHLHDPMDILQKIRAILVDRGLLLVTVPNGFGYFELDSFLWRRISRYPLFLKVLYGRENWFWRKFGSAQTLRRRTEEHKVGRYELTLSTLAPDTDHYQCFTRAKMTRLVQQLGFEMLELRNNTFLAGNVLALMTRELDRFLAWNTRVADQLPAFMASGWLIAAEKSIGRDRL